MTETTITLEDLAALAPDRLGADGRQLVATVGLAESTAGNPAAVQAVKALEKLPFAGGGADNDMGVRQFSGD